MLKSQRREERGDHTVLMNRDGGISSNLRLHLHLIYPWCIYPPTLHPHFYLPLFPLSKLCFPSRLLLSLSLYLPFSPPTNSLIVCFLSLIFHFHQQHPSTPLPSFPEPPPTPSTHSEWCQRSIRQLCSAWRGWRPWRRAALRVSRRQHQAPVRSLLD